ncbi:hypothetical protein BOTCAL_0187g00100 [Botryotinia calthae]|uniref:Uncharacterized protein n=1 Tax=Botryotinia calthae TaxID=38488 RepID=A0A4Y8D2B0_9HELO|nr:hypothetical protein BOTCAL_0187g00100 [Botryotinia calthae]
MDRRRDDEAERNDENSRESQRENNSSSLSPLAPSPTHQNPTDTNTTTTRHPNPSPARPQPLNTHRHLIPPPIHPPFHAYTPQLNPPVSTPESILQRRNIPLSTPFPIADLYQPRETSSTPHQGISDRSSLGAGPSATSPIPVGGATHSSNTTPTIANHPPGRRYSLKKRESHANLSASAPKPYSVKPAISNSNSKSSRVQNSQKPSSSSGTATPTPTPSVEDLSAYVDTMTDSLTETLANLQSAAHAIRRVTMETERRVHARGNSAVAGGEEEQDEDEDEDEEEDSISSHQSAIVDLANKL